MVSDQQIVQWIAEIREELGQIRSGLNVNNGAGAELVLRDHCRLIAQHATDISDLQYGMPWDTVVNPATSAGVLQYRVSADGHLEVQFMLSWNPGFSGTVLLAAVPKRLWPVKAYRNTRSDIIFTVTTNGIISVDSASAVTDTSGHYFIPLR